MPHYTLVVCDTLPLLYANGQMNGDGVATSPPACRQPGRPRSALRCRWRRADSLAGGSISLFRNHQHLHTALPCPRLACLPFLTRTICLFVPACAWDTASKRTRNLHLREDLRFSKRLISPFGHSLVPFIARQVDLAWSHCDLVIALERSYAVPHRTTSADYMRL